MRISRRALLLAALGAAAAPAPAQTPAWTPSKPVEVVVGVGPGGSMDRTARMVRDGLVAGGAIPNDSIVANKPGGGHAVAFAYLLRQQGDANKIGVVNVPIITNKLLGRSPIDYTQFTPLATLFYEQFLFAVRADSPIKDGKDLIARLRADPASVSFSVSSGVGTLNHIAAVQLAKSAGADVNKIKTVSFGSAAEGVTATLGGHVDVAITTPFSLMPFVQAGRLRLLAIAADRRLGGELASVPTWKELGADVEITGPRIVIGPPGLDAAQIAFWEKALREITTSPAWRAELAQNYIADDGFSGHAATAQFFDREAHRLKALYQELGRLAPN